MRTAVTTISRPTLKLQRVCATRMHCRHVYRSWLRNAYNLTKYLQTLDRLPSRLPAAWWKCLRAVHELEFAARCPRKYRNGGTVKDLAREIRIAFADTRRSRTGTFNSKTYDISDGRHLCSLTWINPGNQDPGKLRAGSIRTGDSSGGKAFLSGRKSGCAGRRFRHRPATVTPNPDFTRHRVVLRPFLSGERTFPPSR